MHNTLYNVQAGSSDHTSAVPRAHVGRSVSNFIEFAQENMANFWEKAIKTHHD